MQQIIGLKVDPDKSPASNDEKNNNISPRKA